MTIKSISGITYLVKDIEKTSEFYESLGFRIGDKSKSHVKCYVNWFWAEFIAEGGTGTLPHQPTIPEGNRGVGQYLHIKVENADEFYDAVLSKGMKPDGAPEGSRSTGRSFSLRDPDGYQLVFFEKK